MSALPAGQSCRITRGFIIIPITPSRNPPLDPVVKIGLTVLIGGFVLIAGGMFLSRPDRTIPPYSIGAQEGAVVAVHVPASTSDPAIETLIHRFREVGVATRDFRSLKVRPTTPGTLNALYRDVVLYIFSDPVWTRPDALHRYLARRDGEEEEAFRRAWEGASRGGFIYTRGRTKGWLGPIPGQTRPERDRAIRTLFDDGAASLPERSGHHDATRARSRHATARDSGDMHAPAARQASGVRHRPLWS